jgi:hypothetical protein
MKKITLLLCFLFFIPTFAQDHFSGITTSKRVGILNASLNPSELSNLDSKFEVQLMSFSLNVANNKIGFSDIADGNNLENLVFNDGEPVNFNVDADFLLPGVAFKLLNWGFAVTTAGHIKTSVVDFDPNVGDAFINGVLNSVNGDPISNPNNQRITAATWGELGFSASHKIFENEKNKISGGVTLKLLFPGSYANIGAGNFQGIFTTNTTSGPDFGKIILSNANADINIAYTGGLANSFSNTSDYTKSLFGNLNGMAADFGVNYQLKGAGKSYKLKIGAALKNIGSMTYKGDDIYSKNYELKIEGNQTLDLKKFENISGIKEIEAAFDNTDINGVNYLKNPETKKEFKVKLPTVLNLYADVKVISKLNVTLFLQQKMNSDSANDQITSQNIFSVTPRVSLGFFEAYLPVGVNEISGTTAGLGFRLGGFFLGSNSILTAVTNDSKQADFYTGFRFGFL